jgi:hypothetical protein
VKEELEMGRWLGGVWAYQDIFPRCINPAIFGLLQGYSRRGEGVGR